MKIKLEKLKEMILKLNSQRTYVRVKFKYKILGGFGVYNKDLETFNGVASIYQDQIIFKKTWKSMKYMGIYQVEVFDLEILKFNDADLTRCWNSSNDFLKQKELAIEESITKNSNNEKDNKMNSNVCIECSGGIDHISKKEVVDSSTSFSKLKEEFKDFNVWDALKMRQEMDRKKEFPSRFIPNVVFKIYSTDIEWVAFYNIYKDVGKDNLQDIIGYEHFTWTFQTSRDGSYIFPFYMSPTIDELDRHINPSLPNKKEVSKSEAIPELVPKGMRYNKEYDKLVPDVLVDEEVSDIEELIKGINLKAVAKSIFFKGSDMAMLEWAKKNVCPDIKIYDDATKEDGKESIINYGNDSGKVVAIFADGNRWYYINSDDNKAYISKGRFTVLATGGNHIAFDGTAFDTLGDVLLHNEKIFTGASDYLSRGTKNVVECQNKFFATAYDQTEEDNEKRDSKKLHQNSDFESRSEEQRTESFKSVATGICSDIATMLVEKNIAYGDSALNPIRIFSSSDAIEQINVRIDDKLSRVARGKDYPGDDNIDDLIGYLVLLKIARNKGK